jgi:hypothetical protein
MSIVAITPETEVRRDLSLHSLVEGPATPIAESPSNASFTVY